MAGRHRKPAPARARFAGVAATLLAVTAAGLPTVAVLSRADDGDPLVRAVPQDGRLSALDTVERATARTVSRSFTREVSEDMLAARLAARLAAERAREELAEKRARRALERRRAAAAEKREPSRVRRLASSVGRVPDGVSDKPCPDGSAIESGLQPNAIKVYRAVCAAFPSISAWGGRSGGGTHGEGRALDIMVGRTLGDEVAAYARRQAGALGVSEVIYSQRIWTVQRAGEGWRPMEDRGSATANHYDHVHVTVF